MEIAFPPLKSRSRMKNNLFDQGMSSRDFGILPLKLKHHFIFNQSIKILNSIRYNVTLHPRPDSLPSDFISDAIEEQEEEKLAC